MASFSCCVLVGVCEVSMEYYRKMRDNDLEGRMGAVDDRFLVLEERVLALEERVTELEKREKSHFQMISRVLQVNNLL